MKKLVLLSAIAFGGLMYQPAEAQIRVGLHINLGGPVYTEPATVYEDADYFYLPDVQAYYSVSRQCYFYNDGYNWVSAAYLPGIYRDYDWQHARRFEVHEARPYMHDDVYRARFGGAGHFDWNRRDDHREYANRDQHVDRDRYQGYDHNQYQPRNDAGRNYQPQPQQNYGGGQQDDRNRGQAQPQQDNRQGRGQQDDRNRGQAQDNRQGRGQQFQQQNGGFGRGPQMQPQQGGHNQGNDNRGGAGNGGRDRHGM